MLAGSATAGVAAQALILFVAWKRIGMSLSLNFKWRGFGLRPALKAASWSLGMVLVTQVGGLVQTIVASGAISARAQNSAVASVAAAGIAWLVFMLPHSVATVSIATAYFTKMSTHVHENRMDLLKADLAAGLRSIALISVLATVAISVLAYPISRVFVGEFAAIISLGNVIVALMLGLLPFSFVYMMQRAFFALEDTRTPFWFTAVQIGLHIIGSITISLTVPAEWLVVALSLLTSTTITIQAILAYSLLTRRIGSFKQHGIAAACAKFVISGVLAGLIGYAILQLLGGVVAGSFVVAKVASAGLSMVIAGGVMLAIYVIALRLLRVKEVDTVFSAIKGIVRR
jgi:putative peptidoglycan lipid II flippase